MKLCADIRGDFVDPLTFTLYHQQVTFFTYHNGFGDALTFPLLAAP